MMSRRTHARGFTMVELLIYMALALVLGIMVVTMYLALEKAENKGQSISAVETEGVSAMNIMLQTVRNAQLVSTPALGASTTSISLTTYSSSTSPTVFAVSGTSLLMTEGASPAVALTGSQVQVTNFYVRNLGATGTYGSLKIQFTLSHATTTQKYDTAYTKTFYGSATVRRIPQ